MNSRKLAESACLMTRDSEMRCGMSGSAYSELAMMSLLRKSLKDSSMVEACLCV